MYTHVTASKCEAVFNLLLWQNDAGFLAQALNMVEDLWDVKRFG